MDRSPCASCMTFGQRAHANMEHEREIYPKIAASSLGPNFQRDLRLQIRKQYSSVHKLAYAAN